MSKRRDCDIIHCIDSITSSEYVLKKFKAITFLSVRKPAFNSQNKSGTKKF